MTRILLTALLSVLSVDSAQPAAVQVAMAVNLRQALERAGFEGSIDATDRPDLDRELTSSAFGISSDMFVAGYFFADELQQQSLGPLHVSLFDRAQRRWIHNEDVRSEVAKLGMSAGGAVLGAAVDSKIVLLDTNLSPSAGM